jgi:hypothetical protein
MQLAQYNNGDIKESNVKNKLHTITLDLGLQRASTYDTKEEEYKVSRALTTKCATNDLLHII